MIPSRSAPQPYRTAAVPGGSPASACRKATFPDGSTSALRRAASDPYGSRCDPYGSRCNRPKAKTAFESFQWMSNNKDYLRPGVDNHGGVLFECGKRRRAELRADTCVLTKPRLKLEGPKPVKVNE